MVQQKTVLEYWPVLFGLLLGLFFSTFQLLGLGLEYYPGDLGDARFNMYLLEHAHRYFFIGDVPSDGYWNAPFMYPQESSISFSDNLLGTFIIFSFFRVLGQDVATSFQWWFVVITILNYCSSFIFFRSVTKDKFASVIGALVFTFSIALVGQFAHAQTFPRFCIPLAFLYAFKFYHSFNVRDLFLTVFFVVFQFYCALYLGFMLMVPLCVFLLIGLIYKWRKVIVAFSVKWTLGVLASLAINFALLFPLISNYINSPAMIKEGNIKRLHTYSEIFHSIPTLKSYFFIRSESMLWDWLNYVAFDLESWWDHQLFTGGIVFLSLSFMIVYTLKKILSGKKFNNTEQVIYGATGALIFLFFIRGKEASLYEYLYPIPGFASLRALQRIINVELLFLASVVIFMYLYLVKETKYKKAFFFVFCILFTIDNYIYPKGFPRVNKKEAQERLSLLTSEVDHLKQGELISYEPFTMIDPTTFYHLDAMLVAQQLGLKVVNGYTSTVPLGYYHYAVGLEESGRKIWEEKKSLEEDVTVVKSAIPEEVKDIIQQIKNQEEWFSKIKTDAEENGTTIEQSLLENAFWVYNQDKLKSQ